MDEVSEAWLTAVGEGGRRGLLARTCDAAGQLKRVPSSSVEKYDIDAAVSAEEERNVAVDEVGGLLPPPSSVAVLDCRFPHALTFPAPPLRRKTRV